jgi:phage terminase large subunit-like protein
LSNSTKRSRSDVTQPHPDWSPKFFTPMRSALSDGPEVVEFAESYCSVTKGFLAGQSLVFTDWQKWLMRGLYERDPVTKRLRYRRALIMLPRKNGKSLMGSAIALYGMFAGEPGAEVYSAAGDRQQARIVFGEVKQQILSNPLLAAECKVYRDAIEVPLFGSVYRVLSADGKLAQGLNPTTVIFDELHVQRTTDLYDALTLGSGARKEPLVVGITTPGYDLDSPCGLLYQYGKKCASGELDDPTFGFWSWESDEDCDIFDQAQWRQANPNLAEGLMDLGDMESAAKQTSEMAYRRYRLGQWVRSQESWLPAGAWELCRGDQELIPHEPTWVGVDMALKHDTIAVVAVQKQGDLFVTEPHIIQPDSQSVDVAAVEHLLRELHMKYSLKEVAFDPAFFQRSAEVLQDDGLPMVEFPQSAARMVPACGQAYELIVTGKVRHRGQPTFTDQVLSAAQRMTDNGWRLSKGKSKRKIDAAIALVMALDRASTNPPEEMVPMFYDV